MAYRWRYENAEGTVVVPDLDDAYADFDGQAEAESWLGQTWRALLALSMHRDLRSARVLTEKSAPELGQ